MTETLSHIALKQVFPTNEDFFTVFEGVNLSLDHRNCLAIYAPDLCKDLVQTNDVVALITPNQFRFLGRADFIINSGGAKIHPEDLEKKLKTVLDVELAFVGVKDEVLGEKLVLCVEYIPGLPNEKQKWLNDIHGFSFEKSFYKPKEIFFIRKLPRTENGKINRNELMQMITDKPEV
jgi:O-succinylbenzoic acid--CoA ligase